MGTALVPWWLLLVLLVLSVLAIAAFVLRPIYRWVRAQRVKAVVGEVTHSLQMPLPEFLLTPRRVLADRLANDPSVLEVVDTVAQETNTSRPLVMKRAYKTAYDIVPSFNPAFYFRLGYWVARAWLRSLYRVRLGYQDHEALAQLGDDVSLIFMMNHRTNMDYVLVTYLTAQRSTMSYGVGEWARVWPIQPLMRAAGGYFLRRQSSDPLYRRILERYVQTATEAKVPHAIFPEGRLSRTGGLQSAQLGLLSYITKTFDPTISPDIVLIPIGTNYDSVPEEKTVIAHADESFVNRGRWFVLRSGLSFFAKVAIQMIIRRQRPFGYGCANFGAPISFSDWLRGHWINWNDLDRDGRFLWLQRFGEHFMATIATLIPVLPSSVLCTVLVEADGASLTEDEITSRMNEAWDRFSGAGAHLYLPGGNRDRAVGEALQTLRRRKALIREKNGALQVPHKHWPWVRYTATSVAHFIADTAASKDGPVE
jgi:glycerol-3-phosphate O-acyltransferase